MPSCYDLLASEARMANFVATAKGDIPQDAWFHLGRAHTRLHNQNVLFSWTGTMFEYLMPTLWTRLYPDTVLERSARAAVEAQKAAAAMRRVPWGVSEAAYNAVDANGNYQYQAFGLRGLGLKYTLSDAIVIAPYASALAMATHPREAIDNLRRMASMEWTGAYGFYESADYTHCPPDEPCTLVRCWMTHHQGMILLAICNLLCGSPFVRWFHSEPQVVATELLLHEKAPSLLVVEREPEPEVAEPLAEPAAAG
jgi:hypothetical protein